MTLRDAVRDKTLAAFDEFSRGLALPSGLVIRTGSAFNDSFLLRAYVSGERSDGCEVAITVDVKVEGGFLKIESDICEDDGHVFSAGPTSQMAIESEGQALELFHQWLEQFREYLAANRQYFVSLLLLGR